MLGAIAGDYIGSRFEGRPVKSQDFTLLTPANTYTDDTVLTVAVADCLMNNKPYAQTLKEYFRKYPRAGYGGSFLIWASSEESSPYYSFGNGSAMRVSPVGWFFNQLDDVLLQAKRSASVTHNHPEGVKGAQAVALSVFLARQGMDKDDLLLEIQNRFSYDLSTSLNEIRPWYSFDVTCQGSVPQSLRAFLESRDYEDAVRKAVSLGGDSDTQACIAGAVAEAYYQGVPEHIAESVLHALDSYLRKKVLAFAETVGNSYRF